MIARHFSGLAVLRSVLSASLTVTQRSSPRSVGAPF
jgi:hypothetical protein